MTILKTRLDTAESARRERFEPTGTISSTNTQKAVEEVAIDAAAAVAAITGPPIFILATGQSNFVENAGTALSPPANAFVWNNTTGTDGANGTAFVALNTRGSFTNPDAFAINLAKANANRNVYVLNVSFSAQTIAHWMVGAPTPDAYANITANISLALTAAGVSTIDIFLWWQGESQTSSPQNYVTDWETVMTRFKAETWFPRTTPVMIYGLVRESVSAAALASKTNSTTSRLQQIVQREPDTRRFVDPGLLDSSFWDGSLHLNTTGVRVVGILALHAFEHGPSNNALLNPLTQTLRGQVLGRPARRNLMFNGDFTANPWVFGTSFTSVANGTQITDDIKWIQSGTGVVDILRSTDAPTIAQAGVFTQHSLHVDVTTADTDLTTFGDYYGIEIDLPAPNVSFLGFGQTGALSLTWSFWLKSTITGNYFIALQNSAQNRYYTTQFTVDAADTWEKKVVTIPGDTTGTWLYTSGVGIKAFITLASSDTYLFTADVWGAADVRVGSATRANAMSSSSNNFKIALIQPEEGIDASVFARVPVSDPSTNVQTFTASGTWTKPSQGQMARIQVWGAGGGGARRSAGNGAGGGAGAYYEKFVTLASLGATETVTIGTGGAVQSTDNTDGTNGGTTSFGSVLTVYGGRGGQQAAAGTAVTGGGSSTHYDTWTAGSANTVGLVSGQTSSAVITGTLNQSFFAAASTGATAANAVQTIPITTFRGGAGGAGHSTTGPVSGVQNTSLDGGNGGAGNGAGAGGNGSAPGGGGGSGTTQGGSGGNGRIIVTVF